MFNSIYKVKFFINGDETINKYRVIDKEGKNYLLKLCKKDIKHDTSAIDSTLLESKILNSLNCPNIEKLITSGIIDINNVKYNYLIFDFISGETLDDKFDRETLISYSYSISLIITILNILENLHQNNNPVIHNNICPMSIGFDYSESSEKIVLTNFEFARFMNSKTNHINLDKRPHHYIAPEIFNGIYTPQSDIFSVGVLLLNLLIASPSYDIKNIDLNISKSECNWSDGNYTKKLYDIKMSLLNHLTIPELQKIIKKASSFNFEDRYANVIEFRNDLESILEITNEDKREPDNSKLIEQKKTGFKKIAGMNNVKNILYNDVIRALNEPDLFKKYGVSIPNGMLLYGPPGCGKTFISKQFAEEVGFNFIELKPSDIKSMYINATEDKINEIFNKAEKKAPSIIFIDEIDAVVPNRDNDLNQMYSGPVNEFLVQMSNCSEKNIFIIAASNRPDKIDSSILRTGRIDKIIYIPPPDYDARVSMFKMYLINRPTEADIDFKELATLTNNYVSSDIKYIIDEASRKALSLRIKISQQMLKRVIIETKPSVTTEELHSYNLLKESFRKT